MAENNMNALPLWAKFTAYLGFPIAVATVLLWVVVKQLEGHNAELLVHDLKVERHMEHTVIHSTEVREAMRHITYILQVMCQNSAKNPSDRNRCFEKP